MFPLNDAAVGYQPGVVRVFQQLRKNPQRQLGAITGSGRLAVLSRHLERVVTSGPFPPAREKAGHMITLAEPIDLDTLRIRHEYLTVVDLRLSADTAAALLHLSQRHATVALESLVTEQFLVRLSDGRYARHVETVVSPRSA
jgi:hypothetical protein